MKNNKNILITLIVILTIVVIVVLSFLIFHIFFNDEDPVSNMNDSLVDELDDEEVDTQEYPIDIGLSPQNLTFSDGSQATLRLPEGFNVSVAAEDLGKARFMTMSPDERVFIPDMVDYNLSHEGSILILEDFNEETGEFGYVTTYLSNLRGPNNVEFYTDNNGDDWIYITLTEHLVRFPYEEGDVEPSGEMEVIFEFPNEQNPTVEDSIVWHITRTILFDGDVLYVSIGSGCNVCEESYDSDGRPAILTMTPEGDNVEVYAEGIKNAVGIELVNGELYATENGVDHISPNDLLYKVEKGSHYGWPYCYEIDGQKLVDPAIDWDHSFVCEEAPLSFVAFAPHSAPLGLRYFDGAHPALNNSFLVAMQGSWQIEVGNGYEVRRVNMDGEQDIFIDGFLAQNEDGEPERIGRPVGILQYDENSFFISDDWNGGVYYVYADH